jgi:hypothetical protein
MAARGSAADRRPTFDTARRSRRQPVTNVAAAAHVGHAVTRDETGTPHSAGAPNI